MQLIEEPVGSPRSQELIEAYLTEVASRFGRGLSIGHATHDTDKLSPPTGVWFLVVDDAGTVLGCGGLRWMDEGRAEIKRMYVAPAGRGHGTGRQLLDGLEDQARAHGTTEVVLDTRPELTEAVGLYRAAGYREVPPYNDNPDAGLWFAKQL